jgi:hypothetical protein
VIGNWGEARQWTGGSGLAAADWRLRTGGSGLATRNDERVSNMSELLSVVQKISIDIIWVGWITIAVETMD